MQILLKVPIKVMLSPIWSLGHIHLQTILAKCPTWNH